MRGNPIRDILPDKYYYQLLYRGFLNDRAIRDYYLKKKFHQLKSQFSPREIFTRLQKEFPYICNDTIRKIIYTRNGVHLSAEPGNPSTETASVSAFRDKTS